MTISDYTRIAIICKVDYLIFYQIMRVQIGIAVLLKVPAITHPTPSIISRLKNEYELARLLDSSCIAKPMILEHQGSTVALILEAVPNRTLAAPLDSPMATLSFLRIAICITATLLELHRHELIHKDIKPEHVLLDSGDNVLLIGLVIVCPPREHPATAVKKPF